MRFATSLLNSKAKHTLRALMLIMEGYHGAIPTPPTGNGTLAMPPIQSGQVESLVDTALNFRKCIHQVLSLKYLVLSFKVIFICFRTICEWNIDVIRITGNTSKNYGDI